MNSLTTPDDPETARLITAIAEGNPQSGAELAALAQTSEALATAFAVQHADAIRAEAVRARLSGRAHITTAQRIVGKAFDRINEQLETADGFDAAELVKPALRVLEAAEKARLAERETGDDLPIFNITINGGGVQIQAVAPDDVVDVIAKELRGEQ